MSREMPNVADPQRGYADALADRSEVLVWFAESVAHASSSGVPLTLAVLEVDELDAVNLRYGREWGDALLREVIRVLREVLPEDARLADWRGGQFLVVVPGRPMTEAMALMSEALRRFKAAELDGPDGDALRTSFSAGVAAYGNEKGLSPTVEEAQRRLYMAKAAGGGRVMSEAWDKPRGEGPATILVVEDEATTASLLRHHLEKEGFSVRLCGNGRDALDAVLQERCDLVLSDIHMPEMDGLELLARIRENPRLDELPLVMLTCSGDEDSIVRAFKLGADDYVTKPFSTFELLARIQRRLRKRA